MSTENSINARIKWLLIAGGVFVAVAAFLVLVWSPYQRQMRLIEEIEEAMVIEIDPMKNIEIRWDDVKTEPVGPDWLRQLVGDERMRGFEPIVEVNLDLALIDDAWLKKLSHLSNLEVLSLDETQISDKGLNHLASLSFLRELSLYGTQISDEGVEKLQQALPDCEIVR